jgi:biopolymer transport protein ExbB/TolQ
MIDLLFEGGILFMSILTLSLAAVLGLAIRSFIKKDTSSRHIDLIKSVGLFALVFGLLGQFIGLYSALSMIESAGAISPAILAGGLKVSSITSIYGMIIFVISYLIWFGLNAMSSEES